MTTGSLVIVVERARHIAEEGYDAEHDRGHAPALANAAECYLWAYAAQQGTHAIEFEEVVDSPPVWPWDDEYWKPARDDVRNLVKAGSLIAATIDSLLAERARPDDGPESKRAVEPVIAYRWTCAGCQETGLEFDEETAEDVMRDHLAELHD